MGAVLDHFGFLSGLALAAGAVLKGCGFLALIGGGLLAASLALLAAVAVVALVIVLGLAAGAAGLALGLFVVALILGAVLLPFAVPVLLLYLLMRPRRPASA
jgi:hypothetical protein